MLKQIYYSTRERLSVRIAALMITLGVNFLFVLLAIVVPGSGVMITAVVFSSLTLAYLIMANMFVSFAGIHEVFSAPKGYHTLLAPVPAWKIILGRVAPAAIMDTVMMAIGISFVVWQSLRLTGITWLSALPRAYVTQEILFGMASAMAGYALMLTVYCFFRAISKSVLYRAPARTLLGILLTIAALWLVSSLFNLLLLPFGSVDVWRLVVFISLHSSPIVRVMFVLVTLLQAAVFFLASARLMERRLNV